MLAMDACNRNSPITAPGARRADRFAQHRNVHFRDDDYLDHERGLTRVR